MKQFYRELIKTLCIIALLVGSIAAGLCWVQDQPGTIDWICRIGGPILAVLAIAIFLKIEWIPDGVPDYLRRVQRKYYIRDGFCFVIVPTAVDGVAYFDLFFQSQFSGPSIGMVALRPAKGFFLTRNKIELITYRVECPPGGFGFVRLPIPIPARFQGKRQSFEIGASVHYPDGKGEQLRFDQNGVHIGANTDFFDSLATAITFLALTAGNLSLASPTLVKIKLPVEVADQASGIEPVSNVLWQLGEPELQFDPAA